MTDDHISDPSADITKVVQPPEQSEITDTEKFRKIQSVADQREKENAELRKQLEDKKTEFQEFRTELDEIKNERETKNLEMKYPDIEPELLQGRTPEQIEKVVEKQRARMKEINRDKIDITPPDLSATDLQKEVENVRSSQMAPVEKAKEIMRLQRLTRGE